MSRNKARSDNDDYDFSADPKRKNYKKIKLQIKKAMIKGFYEDGIGISTLTKKYHLSYSTIAHILKVYKEKNKIFESKRLKSDREQESSILKQGDNQGANQGSEEQKVKIQAQTAYFYLSGPM